MAWVSDFQCPGFVQTLESPGIKMLRFPGLESPGKGIGPGNPGNVLEF